MNKDAILEQLKQEIAGLPQGAKVSHVGEVVKVGDGVATVKGLKNALYSELLEFETASGESVSGIALNLEEYFLQAIILGNASAVAEGQTVKSTGKVSSIPVSDNLIGRVVDPLGNPKDGGPAISASVRYPLEKIASGVISRESVNTPL